MREYLAAGLPVVATPLPEILKLNALVRLARTPQEFLTEVEVLLREGRIGPDPAVSALMELESWDQKVEELSGLVTGLHGDTPPCPIDQRNGQEVMCPSE